MKSSDQNLITLEQKSSQQYSRSQMHECCEGKYHLSSIDAESYMTFCHTLSINDYLS